MSQTHSASTTSLLFEQVDFVPLDAGYLAALFNSSRDSSHGFDTQLARAQQIKEKKLKWTHCKVPNSDSFFKLKKSIADSVTQCICVTLKGQLLSGPLLELKLP